MNNTASTLKKSLLIDRCAILVQIAPLISDIFDLQPLFHSLRYAIDESAPDVLTTSPTCDR